MRKDLAIIIGLHVIFLLYALYEVFELILLLVPENLDKYTYTENTNKDNHIDTSIADSFSNTEYKIPKIIHQVWLSENNSTIPEIWLPQQQSCIELHPDYEYILWSTKTSREFLQENYPWFVPTYDSYPYVVMRADAIRYFVLSHYGGVYVDLDNGCARRLDPLLTTSAWVRKSKPTGIGNNVMGFVPKHPFLLQVLTKLKSYNRNWLIPYLTTMYGTGPLFLSVIWLKYKRNIIPDDYQITVIMPPYYLGNDVGTDPSDPSYIKSNPFFTVTQGSSWHKGDASTIKLMGRHWIVFTILITLLVLTIFMLEYIFYKKIVRKFSSRIFRNNRSRYQQLDMELYN